MEFLGLNSLNRSKSALLSESDFSSDLVIDTDIWPERRSFSDCILGPLPSKWNDECATGTGFDPKTACNRKLIGARCFSGGYEATSGRMNESVELRSAMNTDGQGTHTASIAAGRYVYPPSTLGYAHGVSTGMAPKARLAAYKDCWADDCFDSNILAAFNAAVADGVDLVSLSVSGVVVPYYLRSCVRGLTSTEAARGSLMAGCTH